MSNNRKRKVSILTSNGEIKHLLNGLISDSYPIRIHEYEDNSAEAYVKCCTINQEGNLLKFDGPTDYSNSFCLDEEKHNKFSYKIFTKYTDKTLAILLGITENEVGIIIANSETNESKIFSIPIEGNFNKDNLTKIDLRFSADLLTFVVFQQACEVNAFIFDNPLV